MPDQFEQLKQKYQPVLAKIQEEGAQLQNLNLDGNQLYLKATAVSEASKNRIWDAIKAVDPNFADLKHDIEVQAGDQTANALLGNFNTTAANASTGQALTSTATGGSSLGGRSATLAPGSGSTTASAFVPAGSGLRMCRSPCWR